MKNGLLVDKIGTKRYYKDNKLHRMDGPAIEFKEYRAWYKDGQRHRMDGPAMIWGCGYEQWWINGKQVSEEAVHQKQLQSRIDGFLKNNK